MNVKECWFDKGNVIVDLKEWWMTERKNVEWMLKMMKWKNCKNVKMNVQIVNVIGNDEMYVENVENVQKCKNAESCKM